MRERFEHLASIESFDSTHDPALVTWSNTRLDRWLVDWNLRHGKQETARAIVTAKGIEV
jgi:macrophage erythroblast attacher